MTIIHIVLFKIRSSLDETEKNRICNEMLSLKTLCLSPTSQQPYILSSSGGVDNSPEGLQGGLTHGFVVEFATQKDRDYYVAEDPAHLAFVERNKQYLDDARVLDYEKGVY